MAQLVKVLVLKSDSRVHFPAPTLCKEGLDSYTLPLTFTHMQWCACVYDGHRHT